MIGIGRLYSVVFTAVTVSAQQDLVYIKPAADKICIVEAIYLAASGGTADAGDAQEELLRIEVIRVPSTVTVGSGGSAVTPAPVIPNDAAAGFTARTNDTTVATTSGSLQSKYLTGLNIRIPTPFVVPPEWRMVIANAEAIVVRLNLAPNDSVNVSGTCWVEELV